MFFEVFTPVLNPIIYTVRNTEVKNAMRIVANSRINPVISFVMWLVSYVVILSSVRTHSSAGRKKDWSTCSFHVTAVLLSVSCSFMSLQLVAPFPMDKATEVFCILVSPTLSPIIHTVTNIKVKNTIRALLNG
ncbi:hypothetical protein Celaphus_00008817, partial [Cervus elaphus hippelaphus]